MHQNMLQELLFLLSLLVKCFPFMFLQNQLILVTQYAMTELESLGFLKMDFLGLKNLHLLNGHSNYSRKSWHCNQILHKLPLDDPKTFALTMPRRNIRSIPIRI